MDCAGRRATTSQVNLYSDHLGASAAHNSWLSTAIVRSEHPRRENSGCSKKGRRARLSNGDTELRNSPMRSAADEATHVSVDMEIRVPTSVILEGLLHDAPNDQVTLNWIIDHLGARSFGIIMLIIALVGLAPGASPFIGILLAVPAFQMMMARPAPVLPRIIARRKISTPASRGFSTGHSSTQAHGARLSSALAHAVRSNETHIGFCYFASECSTSCADSLPHHPRRGCHVAGICVSGRRWGSSLTRARGCSHFPVDYHRGSRRCYRREPSALDVGSGRPIPARSAGRNV